MFPYKAGAAPEELSVSASVTFVPGAVITSSTLKVTAALRHLATPLREVAEEAKDDRPLSKALAGNVEIDVSARLAA